jgi:hypothetical protein
MLPSPGEVIYPQTAFVKWQVTRFCEGPRSVMIFAEEVVRIQDELRAEDFHILVTHCGHVTTHCGQRPLLVRSGRGGNALPRARTATSRPSRPRRDEATSESMKSRFVAERILSSDKSLGGFRQRRRPRSVGTSLTPTTESLLWTADDNSTKAVVW